MRVLAAITGAVIITAMVFLFMQNLIVDRQDQPPQRSLPQVTDILRSPPEPELEEPDTPEPNEAEAEPSLEELSLSPRAPQAASQVAAPALDTTALDIPLTSPGESWRAPLSGAAGKVIESQGAEDQGFVEVVPFSTRTPNVPELAWRNKISGWVLVAYNVNPDGTTANVRVLDAKPGGVFEEKVVAAVRDWRYQVTFKGRPEGPLVVTQRVEVDWRDFPMNLPNVE